MKNNSIKEKKIKEITLESIREGVEDIEPMPAQKIEVSKKHYKLLAKVFGVSKNDDILTSGMAQLYGIPVYIRPYLKKLRLYTEKIIVNSPSHLGGGERKVNEK